MSSVPPDLQAKFEAFLHQHGAAVLSAALDNGHLFDPGMRAGSKLAYQHSRDYVEAGVPCALVITLHPRAKKTGERTDVRLMTGETKQLTLELPAAPD